MSGSRPHLIETIRIRRGAAPLWPLHWRRLAGSCKALGVPLPETLPPPAGGADRIVRLEVGPAGALVTERPVADLQAVRLVVAAARHRPYAHKTTERAVFEAALAEARAAGADDALLLSKASEVSPGQGYVAEAARWSVFWWEGDRLAGPPLDLGILPGVARARLAEYAGPLLERRVVPAAILDRGPFVANAARGVVPILSIGDRGVAVEARTAALAAEFWPRT